MKYLTTGGSTHEVASASWQFATSSLLMKHYKAEKFSPSLEQTTASTACVAHCSLPTNQSLFLFLSLRLPACLAAACSSQLIPAALTKFGASQVAPQVRSHS